MKSKYLLSTLLLLLGAGACQKNFLDRQPPGELTFDKFFQTSDQAVEATHVDIGKPEGEAKLAQIALRAGDLEPGGTQRD